jgi:hypothetical protein
MPNSLAENLPQRPRASLAADYYDKAPFPFDGHIDRVHVAYT